MTDEDIGG